MNISLSTNAKWLGFASGLALWNACPMPAQACVITFETAALGVLAPIGNPATGFTSLPAQAGTPKNIILDCWAPTQLSVSAVTQQAGPSVTLLPTSSASVTLGTQTATSSGGSIGLSLGPNTVVTNLTVNASAALPSGTYQFNTVLTLTP